MTIPWLHRTAKAGFFCCLAFWLQMASAGPVGSTVTGHRGDTVSAAFFDSVTDFEAADIRLTFDPLFLTFLGASGGTLTSSFTEVDGGATDAGLLKQVLISLAGSPVTGGPPDSLLVASFLINNDADFDTTSVLFEPRQDLGPPVYDFVPTTADITVLRANTVPIGNTGALVLMGLAAMFLGLRSAQAGKQRVALRKLA